MLATTSLGRKWWGPKTLMTCRLSWCFDLRFHGNPRSWFLYWCGGFMWFSRTLSTSEIDALLESKDEVQWAWNKHCISLNMFIYISRFQSIFFQFYTFIIGHNHLYQYHLLFISFPSWNKFQPFNCVVRTILMPGAPSRITKTNARPVEGCRQRVDVWQKCAGKLPWIHHVPWPQAWKRTWVSCKMVKMYQYVNSKNKW